MSVSNQWKPAAILFLIALGFYLYTLAPVVTFVDSGELAAVIGTRGVAHPPGFPLYSLLGSLVALIPIGTLIQKLNAFSALCAALSVGITFLVFCRFASKETPSTTNFKSKKKNNISSVSAEINSSSIGASAAALAWMTNRALWNTATITEVYALHALLISIFFYCLICYSRTIEPISMKYLAYACLIAGLGIANYPPFGILFPAVAVYLYRKRVGLINSRTRLLMFGLFSGGLIPYILLPVRANSDPLLNWGNPLSWGPFWDHVSAAQYKVFLGSPDYERLSDALLLWRDQWPIAVWLLVFPGVVFLWKFRVREFLFTMLVGITNIIYVLTYDIVDVESAPSDYYAYLLPLCWSSAIWIGGGIQWIALAIRRILNRTLVVRTIYIVLLTLVPIITGVLFWDQCNRRDYRYADDFARSILVSLPPNSLVLTPDWTFVSPSLYLQHVEGVRNDVVVLDTELLRRSWYFQYLKKRAPWLHQMNRNHIAAFSNELFKFEASKNYQPSRITEYYVKMINGFISTGLQMNHPPHILLNLEAKEADPQIYRQWEKSLGRPPFVTLGVAPNLIGSGFQWVPETLAFRLYSDAKDHALPPAKVPPRPIDLTRPHDSVTRGVFARYAEFWRWRGDYLKSQQKCFEALSDYERALQIKQDLSEANDGLSYCIEKLATGAEVRL